MLLKICSPNTSFKYLLNWGCNSSDLFLIPILEKSYCRYDASLIRAKNFIGGYHLWNIESIIFIIKNLG